MGYFSVLLVISAAIVSTFGSAIQEREPLCPPPEQIEPCKCSKISKRVTARCSNLSNQDEVRQVFDKNPEWSLQDVHFDQCVIEYLPSSIVKTASFETLNVTSSTLVSLFDAVPVKASKHFLDIHLRNVKLLRGIEWKFFSNTNLGGLEAKNVAIKNFGSSFKEHMPPVVKNLWFENTKTMTITHQSFQRLVNLEIFTLMGGSLKKISRDMFPRPWNNITFWNLSEQKIAALPKDIFADLPKLRFFSLKNNYLTTISKEVFIDGRVAYALAGNPIVCNCEVKWITTSKEHTPRLFLGKCAEPTSFKGREFNTLTADDFRYCR